MKNKIIIAILVVAVLGTITWQLQKNKKGCWFGSCGQDAQIIEQTPVEEQEVPIQKPAVVYNLSEATDRYEVQADMTPIKGMPIEQDVLAHVTTLVREFKSNANGNEFDPEFAAFPWSLEFNFDIRESQKITSVIVQGYEYTGGAHPNSYTKTFHYEKSSGKSITIKDIVPNAENLYTFAALADKVLVIDFPEGLSGESYDNWNTWYTTDTEVVFIFDPYQIAAYAQGQQEFPIVAIGENKTLFNQKYFVSE